MHALAAAQMDISLVNADETKHSSSDSTHWHTREHTWGQIEEEKIRRNKAKLKV